MKVCFIFRQPRTSAFSIEKVFQQIVLSIRKRCNVHEVYLPFDRIIPKYVAANIQVVKNQQADVFHVTGDVHYVVMALPKRKTILTIHDCVFIENSSGLKRRMLKFFFLDWPVRHAAFITTISEKSKQDILRYTGCDETKIRVIPNPVTAGIYYEPRIFNTARPVVLFLGSKPNKNLMRVLEALQGTSCLIDLVGTVSPEARVLIDRFQIDYISSNNISEQQLATKYASADIIMFPSVYEGFGLPITEGNKAGRVVITSNLQPMKDIASNAACLVDPFDVRSIREGFLKVVRDESYRKELIRNGFENVKRFDLEYIAEQYFAVYQKIGQENYFM